MDLRHQLFTAEALLALATTIALGYFVGKLMLGIFVLGGIAGTLPAGVVIGQLGINIAADMKAIDRLIFAAGIGRISSRFQEQYGHAMSKRVAARRHAWRKKRQQ